MGNELFHVLLGRTGLLLPYPAAQDKVGYGDFSQTIAPSAYNPVMARIWKEQFESAKHNSLPDALPDVVEPIRRHRTAPTLIPHEVVFVSVCSFTFRFDTKSQLERVLAFYERKTIPSTRKPESVWSLRGGDPQRS